ncbi:MAG TPA: hypothetical protein VNT75_20560 [Symbiobacteriaceae bacterium]|nr:hypothetical protein [Symbiobacteriaceae bacterium]
MQQAPGPGPGPGPGPFPPQPDPGVLAMQTVTGQGQLSTIATAQLIGGLSGLLVSEGLARVVRDILGGTAGEPPAVPDQTAEAAETTPPEGEGEMLTGLSAKAVKELLTQGVASRIIALNSVNTYLSLATAEQLRRIGAQIATGEGLPIQAPQRTAPQQQAPQPAAPAGYQCPYPYPGPVYWSQVPPGPYRWR